MILKWDNKIKSPSHDYTHLIHHFFTCEKLPVCLQDMLRCYSNQVLLTSRFLYWMTISVLHAESKCKGTFKRGWNRLGMSKEEVASCTIGILILTIWPIPNTNTCDNLKQSTRSYPIHGLWCVLTVEDSTGNWYTKSVSRSAKLTLFMSPCQFFATTCFW